MPEKRTGKERILDAVLVVLASGGAEHLSIRHVATEAGVSIGAVQHHFPTKDELIIGAMAAVKERFLRQTGALLALEPTAEGRLRTFCYEISCVRDAGLTAAIVWTAFASRASTDERIRKIHAAEWADTELFLLGLLRSARPGEAIDADDAALVLAVADGIAVARAAEQGARLTPTRAKTLIDRVLDQIAGHTRPG